jgi:BirA family biotin operon repressor/biotin-[acetyl-CoA-carboxylase] ligase
VLTHDDLLAALAAIPIEAPVRADEVTGSTNATAVALAESGTPEWTLVAAGHQTEGRGRLGRAWVDAPGRALMFSFVLRPDLPPARAGVLPLLAGACMATAIRDVAGRKATCKWPNDLMLGEAKVGGILAESAIDGEALRYAVIGVGVNLDAPEGVPGAGALGPVGELELLTAFVTRFASIYGTRDASLPERVRQAWTPVSSTIGELVRATTTAGEERTGRAVGIDGFGSLLLSTDTGEVWVRFGDVEHLASG